MARPIIKRINPFDPSKEQLVEFVWDGNIPSNNKLVIYDAETTTSKVYEHQYADKHAQLNHIIPANTLTANHKYAATIQVFDQDNIESQVSEKMTFWTVSIPTFQFADLNAKAQNSVKNATFGVHINYSSSTGDKLTWIKFRLYDANKILLVESSADYTPTLSYLYKELGNNTSYYVQAVGETSKGLYVETPKVLISVHYENPILYTQLQAKADPQTGFVNYNSNLVVVSPTKKDYRYENGFVDLTTSESSKALALTVSTGISNSKPFNAPMSVQYIDRNGKTRGAMSKTNTEVTISGYKNLKQIRIQGNTVAKNSSKLGDSWTIENINSCNLQIDKTKYSNLNDGFRMGRIGSHYDELVISEDGQCKLITNIEQFKFTADIKAVKTEKSGNTFITYYDVGAMKGLNDNDLMCIGIPVGVKNATNISLDPTTGYIKIVWYLDSHVIDERDVKAFFECTNVYIQYVRAQSYIRELTPRALPPEIFNSQYARYQDNISIPSNATFKFIAKCCRRTAPLLKVLSPNSSGFILSGLVNEMDEFRLKLQTVGTRQIGIIYSDILKCNYTDIMKVFVRRVNGMYQLKVQVLSNNELEQKGVWLSQPNLSSAQEGEVWFDLTSDSAHISENEVQLSTESSVEQETNLPQYTIWIGDEEI